MKRLKLIFLTTLIKLWTASLRIKVDDQQRWKQIKEKKTPVLFFFWHRHLFVLLKFFQNSSFRPLISLSSDGELIAQIAQRFGLNPIRGSSSRHGAAALLTILKALNEDKATVLITADGPRGPARKLKPGILKITEHSPAALFPISWYGSNLVTFKKSWDQFLLPLPFSKIYLRIGENLKDLPETISSEKLENCLNQLENECIKFFNAKRRKK